MRPATRSCWQRAQERTRVSLLGDGWQQRRAHLPLEPDRCSPYPGCECSFRKTWIAEAGKDSGKISHLVRDVVDLSEAIGWVPEQQSCRARSEIKRLRRRVKR